MSGNSTTTADAAAGAHDHHRAFGRAYWMLNSIEMFERLAYFGIRAVVPLYIMQATEPGGLHLSALHKGWIYMWWAIFQSFLPMVTGGIADRYGYKRVLFFAISANVVGYIMMANFHDYYGFFASILVLATGTAFFKPALQGSLAQSLTKENSSLGWGIFYWVVNVGAFAAPFISTIVLGKPHSLEGWQTLFYFCAAFTSCNLLLLLTFKDVPSGADKTETMTAVLARTIENVWPYWFSGGTLHPSRVSFGILLGIGGIVLLAFGEGRAFLLFGLLSIVGGTILVTWLRGGTFTWQLRLPAWLLIMSCFWLMMYQLWDLHPNFITDWVDSSMVAAHVPFDTWWEWGDRGMIQVPQQILLNLNAALIILLMVPMSWVSGKMRTLSAMMVGMSVATIGVLVAGWTMSGWIFLAGVVFFSLGEMWTGPKKNEYLGLIAPPGKKGLYLGYVNIPIGIGVGIGSYFGGWLYDSYGEKATLALKELAARPALVARAAQSADWSDALDKLPELLGIEREQALAIARDRLEQDPEETADTLRRMFRYDAGQITNLALIYLAEQDEFQGGVERGRADAVTAGELPEDAGLARCLDRLPEWIDKKRVVAFEITREIVNGDDGNVGDTAIITMLWERYGNNAEVVNNLALEYLAQGTSDLHDAIERYDYQHPPEELKARIKEITEGIGIGRTKSFSALSAAMGGDAAALEQALDESGAADVYCYLAGLDHRRFIAVAPRDWTKDVTLLREMVATDAGAQAYVDEHVWEKGWWERVTLIFGEAEEQDVYERLADNQDLIQQALDRKDWSNVPEQAARLLRLNPFEARALAAAEVNSAAQAATQMLWDKYHPNRKVWLPMVAVGVVATIALGIFGQMAKRWKDMNA